jgi:uncharacterized LabA/DUF88 family protein
MGAGMTGVIVDSENLKFCVNKAFNGKVDYARLLEHIREMTSDDEIRAFIYGFVKIEHPFTKAMANLGYVVRMFKAPRNPHKLCNHVPMTLDVIEILDRLDTLVICSSEPGLAPLIDFVRAKGIEVIVYACGIPLELRNCDRYEEIQEVLCVTEAA